MNRLLNIKICYCKSLITNYSEIKMIMCFCSKIAKNCPKKLKLRQRRLKRFVGALKVGTNSSIIYWENFCLWILPTFFRGNFKSYSESEHAVLVYIIRNAFLLTLGIRFLDMLHSFHTCYWYSDPSFMQHNIGVGGIRFPV